MRIEDLLKEVVKTRMEEIRSLNRKKQIKKKKHKRKKPEKLSVREINELMGVYRDIYKRGKGGALRRK